MPLIMNSHAELYRSDDFEPPRSIALGECSPRAVFGFGTCVECGREFEKRGSRQVYCSEPCKYTARKKREAARRGA